VLQELRRAVTEDDFPRTRQILQNTVSGYQPDSEIVDLIHQQRQQSLRPQKLSEATLGSPAGFTQT